MSKARHSSAVRMIHVRRSHTYLLLQLQPVEPLQVEDHMSSWRTATIAKIIQATLADQITTTEWNLVRTAINIQPAGVQTVPAAHRSESRAT